MNCDHAGMGLFCIKCSYVRDSLEAEWRELSGAERQVNLCIQAAVNFDKLDDMPLGEYGFNFSTGKRQGKVSFWVEKA